MAGKVPIMLPGTRQRGPCIPASPPEQAIPKPANALSTQVPSSPARRSVMLGAATAGTLAVLGVEARAQATGSRAAPLGWGTYLKPFAATSLWNARPVSPVFGDFVIPRSDYAPLVGEGKYSTGVFLAKASDGPVTITGLPGRKGLWNPDSETIQDVTIPRWPEGVLPAEGTDGHADIVDPLAGIVHSFWQLRRVERRWVAEQYAWTRLAGRGWGDPAHYFQGARAAAVPTLAGLVRKHEVGDGAPNYAHALMISLTFNALAAKPSYIFPATSGDSTAATTNSGAIPEGALLMLPEGFDVAGIANPELRKVAQTLKVFGAYVVDRNHGTPFYVCVENGSDFNLHRGGWNNGVAADLDRIRAALRQVMSTAGWIDGNGRRFTPDRRLNLLSMRGPWRLKGVPTPGFYDSWSQAVVFPAGEPDISLDNVSGRGIGTVSWGVPVRGEQYRLTAQCTGGAKLRLQLRNWATKTIFHDTGEMGHGDASRFTWPMADASLALYATSGTGGPSSVRGILLAAEG